MLSVKFKVSYRLIEYVQFWREQLVFEVHADAARRRKLVSRHVGPLAFFVSIVVAPLVYFYKVNKVGECEFTMDATCVSRTSKGGTLSYPWSSITAIHRYEPGYLIATKGGAMPIPYRALSLEQSVAVAQIISSWERSESAT